MSKASRKKNLQKRNFGQILTRTVSPIILAAVASLFPAANVTANVITQQVPGGQIVTVNTAPPNPWTSTIGNGIGTPAAGTTYVLNVQSGAAISVTNRNAISLGNNLSINIDGTVTGNSSSGGIYGTGPNVIEANSGVTIRVNPGGIVQQIGSTTNGEAINLHGFGNTILNYGTISGLHSAAIWFQDTVSGGGDPSNRNVVTNYGTIETRVDGGSVIGTSVGNGIVFYNKSTGVVNGNLAFSQGNDDLYFEAGSEVNGDINGGGGTNNVLLEGDSSLGVGTLNGYVQNFQTLTKIDTGTWVISGQLQGFRTTMVDDGILRILGDNSRYTGTLLINPSGTVEARAQSLPSNGSAGPNNGNLTNNGTLRFVQGVSYDSDPDDPTDVGTYYGQIVGTGRVEVDGPGTVILAPTNANGNTYSGGTIVKRGTLAVGADNALGADSGGLVLGNGGNVGTLRLQSSFDLGPNRSVQLAGAGGVIDTQGYTTTISQTFQADSTNLYKQGTGTLILTGDSIITGDAHVRQGTLQLGDGGTTGSLVANYDISTGAVLAYAHSNDVAEVRSITGGGKVIQRGTGSLTILNFAALYAGTAYTGGTEIESGTLYINDSVSYNQADHRATVHPERAGTKSGYITFTGADGDAAKNVILNSDAVVNSFRTQTGAGDDNNLILLQPSTVIYGVNIEDDGAAFYVADGTTMTVVANELLLSNNIANGQLNDLYVEAGGTFNLGTGSEAVFDSGIDGDGTLNLVSISSAAMVQLSSSADQKTFHIGTTNVIGTDLNAGTGLGAMYLNTARNDAATEARIVFDHTNSFNIDGGGIFQAAILAGDGIIQAGNEINVVNGAVLTPFDLATFGLPGALPETLTLRAPTVNLSDFVLAGQVGYTSGAVQNPLQFDSQDIPISNNDLLYIDADTVNLESGLIYLQTAAGTTFTSGNYLVVRSTNGFSGVTTNEQLNALLAVNVDGFDLNPASNSPRGGYELQLGGDPDPTTGAYTTASQNNIWFTHDLNSLTMAWTGGENEATPGGGDWDSGEQFYSLQDHNGIHEQRFTTGDKVHISGTNAFEINLLSDSVLMPGKIVTSGLVVGRNVAGIDTDSGDYTLSGTGGIAANTTSAFGIYVGTSLTPTGKLEKYGNSILTFTNTGGNLFEDGIDLYGGTTGFNRVDQLGVGSGKAITFVDDATLQANASLVFTTPMIVNSGVTGTIDVGDDLGLFLGGNIEGPGNLVKAGGGVLQFADDVDSANAIGNTTVEAGKFRIVGTKTDKKTYNSTGIFTVNRGAELSGGGIVAASRFDISGKIASDTYTMGPDDMVVTGDDRFATITLRGNDPGTATAVFHPDADYGGFVFDYRVIEKNDTADLSVAENTKNDLLAIRDMNSVVLEGGVINVMTDSASLSTGAYLVIDSDVDITGEGGVAFVAVGDSSPTAPRLDGIGDPVLGALRGTINGNDITSGGPRGDFEFVFNPTTPTDVSNTKQIWLTVARNTLETVWQGGDGVWSTGKLDDTANPGWKSVQYTNPVTGPVYDNNFYDGDRVYFNDAITLYTVTVDRGVVTSGVDVDLADAASTVTLNGPGNITAIKNNRTSDETYIEGQYVEPNNGNPVPSQGFYTTAMLRKSGDGTLILATETANVWDGGTEIYGGTIKLSGTDVLGVYTGSSNGKVTFRDGDNTNIVSTREQTIVNQFHVDIGITGARLATEDASGNNAAHLAVTVGTGATAAVIETEAQLILDAAGGDIVFTNNAADISLDAASQLNFRGNQNIYLNGGIFDADSGDATKTVTRESGGFTQIGANSALNATTTVENDGIFRVIRGVTYGDTGTFNLNAGGTLAGGGTVKADTFAIGGIIAPDAATFSTGNTTLADTNKYGNLTLQGNSGSSTAVLDGFTFQYDAKEANTLTNKSDTPNDLLSILGMNTITVHSGTINITPSDTYLESGKYLIVDSDREIFVTGGQTDANLNDKIKGRINGTELENLGARVWYSFRFNDTVAANESSDPHRQIWLDAELNSLTMDWTPTGGSVLWDTATANFTSLQKSSANNVAETFFRNGDKVHFSGNADLNVTLNSDVLVSGMVAGRDSGTTGLDGTDTSGTVTISGTGGVHATTSDPSIVGRYLDPPGVGTPKLQTTGMLQKYGDGTLVFRNTGVNMSGNLFEDGVELYDGVTAINQGNQLGVGSGRAVTFKDGATLRSDAVVAMNQTVNIDGGVTATFHAGTDQDGNENALLLDGTLAESNLAVGSVTKTGAGILQIKSNAAISGMTMVEEGTFRVVGDRLSQTVYGNNVADSHFTLADGAILAGGGIVQASDVIVNGTLAPDSTALTEHSLVIDEQRGTLTLRGANTLTLKDFTFEYDVAGVNDSDDTAITTPNDLLRIEGNTTLVSGSVNLLGALNGGSYLIIDSDSTITVTGGVIDGIERGGVLEGYVNGNRIVNATPRGGYEFEMRDGVTTASQIWLVAEHNTLTMNRHTGGDWFDSNWKSTQYEPAADVIPPTGETGYAHSFENGDWVNLSAQSGDEVALSVNSQVLVSGLNVDAEGNLQISGSGGIRATSADDSIEGVYINDPSWTNDRNIIPTGELVKTGNGVLNFRNTGGNDFEDGIFITAGIVAVNQANQLGGRGAIGDSDFSTGNAIAVTGSATLRTDDTMTLYNSIQIDEGVTATFNTSENTELEYAGNLTNSDTARLIKDGQGVLSLLNRAVNNNTGRIGSLPSDYTGSITATAGQLNVFGDYGKTNSFTVQNTAILSGTGMIGALNGGVIESGGILKPAGLSPFDPNAPNTAPVENALTVRGNLTFEAGSGFDVRITQFGKNPTTGKYNPYSDRVNVTDGGVVSIADGQALLHVEFDYWGGQISIANFNAAESDYFTIIDASQGSAADESARFAEPLLSENLPRGIQMEQGWRGNLFQLWFEGDPDNGFANLCTRHNRIEIGGNLDQLILEGDPALKDLIDHLSDPTLSDKEVCNMLDWIHGDLTPNSMMMALKQPWRHPFNRLSLDSKNSCDPCTAIATKNRYKRQLWGEFYGRYDDVRSDNNAHPFTVNRWGVVVGMDQKLSQRSIVGLAFNYSDPRLRQTTGKTEMDDYEIGLYSLTRLNQYEMKLYLGYSHQRYDIDRQVFLQPTGRFAAVSERFGNKTDGNALAASLELTRPIQFRKNIKFLPTVAFDFEQAWMKGYRESGGLTALEYDNSTLERMMLRFGLGTEIAVRNNLDLNARIQYATQLNGTEYARTGVRFANATMADQRRADIWGTRIGRDYLNLGMGANWKPGRLKNMSLFVNYDADLYDRATVHAGEFGLTKQW